MTRGARLGIDLGTAHTVAVLGRAGREPRLLLFDGSPLLPSAVYAEPDGRVLTGRDAQHAGLADPAAFEPHPKRCIDDRTVLLGEREIAVPDLLGAVLLRVADEAGQALGEAPDETVLTYPAAWATTRRGTLLTAASAVLPNVRLLPEPVAAAHHFAAVTSGLAPGESALVYDFGAGTFDATVVRRAADGYQVLATEGLPDCGGLDVDAAIVAYLGTVTVARDPDAWTRLTAPATPSDQRYRRQLWDGIRTAKEVLSRASNTYVHLPLLDRDEVLGREQLDALVAPIVERTLTASRAALRTADVTPTAIYLTGGSSRIPAVTTALHQRFGIAPRMIDQPEVAVAEGAVSDAADPAQSTAPTAPDTVDTRTGAGVPASATYLASARAADAAPTSRSRRRYLALGAAAVATVVVGGVGFAFAGNGEEPGGAEASPSRSTGARQVAAGTSSAAPTASPTPSLAAGVDRCLVGSWRRVSAVEVVKIDGADAQLRGAGGRTLTFRADGVLIATFGDPPVRGTYRGNRWVYHVRGTSRFRYRVSNGMLFGTTQSVSGDWALYRNGVRNNGGPLTISTAPDQYACVGDTLTLSGAYYSHEFARVR